MSGGRGNENAHPDLNRENVSHCLGLEQFRKVRFLQTIIFPIYSFL